MSQQSRPVADVTTGGWAPTPIYPVVNEATPDANAVTSPDNTAYNTFEVKLKPIAWPADGTRTLTVRLRRNGATPARATVMLYQGNRAITGKSLKPGTAYEDVVLTLTAHEASLITDYSDLRVKVAAGDVASACCGTGIPAVLTGKFTNKTGVFTALPDDDVKFIYTNTLTKDWRWDATGLFALGGDLEVICTIGTSCAGLRLFSGATKIGPAGQSPDASPPCACDPLRLVYSVSGTFAVGTGAYKLTVSGD